MIESSRPIWEAGEPRVVEKVSKKWKRGKGDRGTEGQRDRGTKGQRDRGTKGQRDRGTEGQRDRGGKSLANWKTSI
jgi:hypothetical protein